MRLISFDSVKVLDCDPCGYKALYSVITSAGEMTMNGWMSNVSGGAVIDLDDSRIGVAEDGFAERNLDSILST